jgi:hypothetical protein
VKKEWASAADCMKFLTTDHKDDLESKMALVKKIADPATVCSLCKPPKEWLLEVRVFKRFWINFIIILISFFFRPTICLFAIVQFLASTTGR